MKPERMSLTLSVVVILAFLASLSSSVPLIPGWEEDPAKFELEVYVICDIYCVRNIGGVKYGKGQIMQMFPIISQILGLLNIEPIFVGLEFWDKYNWINNTGHGMSSVTPFDWTVAKNGNFLNKTYFDDYILLTGMLMDNNGFKGRHRFDCMTNSRCSGVIYIPQDPNVLTVATAIAHEIGHGLGLEHDNQCCQIGYAKCIMTDVWTPAVSQSLTYSTCSKSTIATYLNSTKSYALRKQVAPAAVQVAGVQCGNGIIEDGEECDCGPSCLPSGCCNCCRNCKLTNGAQCASGKCCNSNTCKFKPSKTLCRKKRDEVCDSDDFCDGKSSECENTQLPNWTDCTDFAGENGYCQAGFCNTINVQCRFVWNQYFKSATDDCYASTAGEKSQSINNSNKCRTLICSGSNSKDLKGDRNPRRTKTSKNDECLTGQYMEVERGYLGLSGTMMVEDGTKCGPDSACFDGNCISKADAVAKIESKPAFARGGYCGNGRIDPGEDCDCGPQQCSCCNLKTCKYQPRDTACLDYCGLCSGTSKDCTLPGSSISDYKQCGGDFKSMCLNGSCVNLFVACQQHFSLSVFSPDLTTQNANKDTLTDSAGGFIAIANDDIVYKEFTKGEDDGVCGIIKCRSHIDATGHYFGVGPNGNKVPYPVTNYPAGSNSGDRVLYYQPGQSEELDLGYDSSATCDIAFPLLTYDGTPCKLANGNDGYCRTYQKQSTKYPSIKYSYSKCTAIPITPSNSRFQFNPFGI